MKIVSFILVMLFITSISLSAQETNEREIVYSGQGKIMMEDGSQIEGNLEFRLTDDHTIFLHKEGVKKPEKIKYKDFKTFSIGDQTFLKIKIITIQVTGSPINNPTNKILVLKSISQSPNISGGNSEDGFLYNTVTEYYVLFTESNTIMSVSDIRVNNKKISSLVASCPELSKKIENKEEGYEFKTIQGADKKMEILLKISEEYQECK